MKTILSATDFSPSSLNACRYAAFLAKKLGFKLTLFNLYDTPVIHSNSGLYFISYDSLKEKSTEKINKLIKEIKSDFPKLTCESFITSGSLIVELEDFIEKHHIEAVVMGLETKTKLNRFIYGSHTTDIAGKINAPVIIVPEKYKKHQLKSIVLAVDNSEKLKKSQLNHFENFLNISKTKIKLLHVNTDDEIFPAKQLELSLNKKTFKVESIKGKDMIEGVNKFVRKNSVDMVTVISKSHSVFYDLFAESNTKLIAFGSKVPTMSIHE